MLATQPPTASPLLCHPKSGGRIPLQPKNTNCDPPKTKELLPISLKQSPLIINDSSNNNNNKENIHINLIDSMDASLAEELTAVKRKLERLKLEKDKTDKFLQERDRFFELQLAELHNRGELQKELEIEVDRLYRLKQLNIASMRMSPIRSLREKEKEQKNKENQFQNNAIEKSEERKEELVDECSTTESPIISFESSTTSSNSTASKSTGTWKIVLPIPLKLRLDDNMNL